MIKDDKRDYWVSLVGFGFLVFLTFRFSCFLIGSSFWISWISLFLVNGNARIVVVNAAPATTVMRISIGMPV